MSKTMKNGISRTKIHFVKLCAHLDIGGRGLAQNRCGRMYTLEDFAFTGTRTLQVYLKSVLKLKFIWFSSQFRIQTNYNILFLKLDT